MYVAQCRRIGSFQKWLCNHNKDSWYTYDCHMYTSRGAKRLYHTSDKHLFYSLHIMHSDLVILADAMHSMHKWINGTLGCRLSAHCLHTLSDKGQPELMVLDTPQKLHLRVSHTEPNDIQWLTVSLVCKDPDSFIPVQWICAPVIHSLIRRLGH